MSFLEKVDRATSMSAVGPDVAPLDEGGKLSKRETGVVAPGTKRQVEFVYRLAKPV